MFGLDVMNVHSSQSQVSAELLLPVQHVVCYLNEVIPVQLLPQVRKGTGREGCGIGLKLNIKMTLLQKSLISLAWALTLHNVGSGLSRYR